jgi:hypothetical protein
VIRSDVSAPTMVSSGGSSLAAGAGPARLPFMHAIVEHRPGARLVAECVVDVQRHRFLLDHTFFGRDMSARDRTLTSLPVMPLAMTLEMMAEAAVTLYPQRHVTALSEIRTRNWLALEQPTCRVRLCAVAAGPAQVWVTASRVGPGEEIPVAEATVELADQAPRLGPPAVADRATTLARWTPEEIYGRCLYHGPAFRAIRSIDRCDGDSIACTLAEPDPRLLFASDEHRGLLLPVVLIDVTGQIQGMAVTGYWTENDSEIDVVFPIQIARIELGPRVPAGMPLKGVCNLRREGSVVHSDAEVTTSDGQTVLRVWDRVEQVFRVPTAPHLYWSRPRKVWLSSDLGPLFADVPGASACSIHGTHRTGGLLLNSMWLRVWTHMILTRGERREFAALQAPPAAMVAWLLARIAAKDVVRAHRSLDLCMADVATTTAADGSLAIELPDQPPLLFQAAGSLFIAVAAAADADQLAGLGLDIQELRLAGSPEIAAALTDQERALIELAAEAADEPAAQWMLAGHSAKQAASRALRGLLPMAPQSLQVAAIDPAAGRISLAPITAGVAAAGLNAQGRIDVYRRLYNNHVMTLCLLPRR